MAEQEPFAMPEPEVIPSSFLLPTFKASRQEFRFNPNQDLNVLSRFMFWLVRRGGAAGL